MIRNSIFCFLVAVLLVGQWAMLANAQFVFPEILSSSRLSLPSADAKAAGVGRGGFTATIEISNLFGVGYVGVSATFSSTLGPLATTRQLGIRVTPIDRHLPAEGALAIELPVTFPQGQARTSVSRSFPKWTIGNSYRVEVIEDGVPIQGYLEEIGSPFPSYAIQSPATVLSNEMLANFLLVQTQPAELPASDDIMLSFPLEPLTKLSRSLEELPSDWRLLSDLDCIVIDHQRLAETLDPAATTSSPAQRAAGAIRDWVLMGGTLVVLGAPDATRLSQELKVSLAKNRQDGEELATTAASVAAKKSYLLQGFRNWLDSMSTRAGSADVGSEASFGGQIIDTAIPVGAAVDSSVKPTSQQLSATQTWLKHHEDLLESSRSNWKAAYRRRAGLGQIIGLGAKEIDTIQSFSVLQELIGFQKSPILERGVDPMMGDFRSRRWLIPGVAEPPVYTFIGILTLFVLLVGPGAYRWTTRGHRSHLMFLIAPALALITTVTMFAYSIIADGFGTTARVRQVTWIDGSSGDAVERTRSTLFAGISPQSGLRFAGDAEVMIYPSGGQRAWRELDSTVSEVRLKAVIQDDAQRFASSFLPARTQRQFITHQIRRGLGKLAIADTNPSDGNPTAPTSDSLRLTSSLEFEVRDLVVRSPDGRYWKTDRIGAGETVSAQWIKRNQDASKRLGELYIRHRPIGAVSQSSGSQQRRTVRDLMLYLNREVSPGQVVVTEGLMERWLNDALFVRGELPFGMFVGIGSVSGDVIAVDGAEQVASVRYVIGTLP